MRCDICTGDLSSTSNGGRCGRCEAHFPRHMKFENVGVGGIIKEMGDKIRDLESEKDVHFKANEIFPPLINKINAIMYEIYQNVLVFDARKYRLQMKFSPSTPKSIVRDAFVEEAKREMVNGPFNSWLNKHLFMIITRNLTTNDHNLPEYNIL